MEDTDVWLEYFATGGPTYYLLGGEQILHASFLAMLEDSFLRQLHKYQFQYIITGEEVKYSGGPERLSEMKEVYERDLFQQLAKKIYEEKMYSQSFPRASNPADMMKQITVLIYKKS